MKYVSIDIETTGLDPLVHDVVEIGAVIDDLSVQKPLDELPVFHCYIVKDNYVTDPYCAFLHQAIFHRISKRDSQSLQQDPELFLTPEEFIPAFFKFLVNNKIEVKPNGQPKIVAAGKNFGSFDKKFLDHHFNFSKEFCVLHRYLDPAILYFNHMEDEVLPNQQECLDRAGIDSIVEHTGVEDAMQVIQLLRHKFPLEDN